MAAPHEILLGWLQWPSSCTIYMAHSAAANHSIYLLCSAQYCGSLADLGPFVDKLSHFAVLQNGAYVEDFWSNSSFWDFLS